MKPLNYKERRKKRLQFVFVFGLTTIILFITGFLTLKTGEKGIAVLEKKHANYVEMFRKKAALTYDLEEIIKQLHQINNKKRNLSQYKKFQDIISDIHDKIHQSIENEEYKEEYVVFKEMIEVIKTIQSDLDTYKENNEKYVYLEELLERCKEKYIEEQEKRKKI